MIAGAAKGRRLTAPRGRRTRPTADRVKEALFSILQAEVPGAAVLDLYAGSGALGIEALSRGAGSAVFVERGRRALEALRDNLHRCGLADRATVVADEVQAALRGGEVAGPVDIALLDPPYDTDPDEVGEVLAGLVPLLAAGAVVVVEADRHGPAPAWPDRLGAADVRRYGDTVLHIAALESGDRS